MKFTRGSFLWFCTVASVLFASCAHNEARVSSSSSTGTFSGEQTPFILLTPLSKGGLRAVADRYAFQPDAQLSILLSAGVFGGYEFCGVNFTNIKSVGIFGAESRDFQNHYQTKINCTGTGITPLVLQNVSQVVIHSLEITGGVATHVAAMPFAFDQSPVDAPQLVGGCLVIQHANFAFVSHVEIHGCQSLKGSCGGVALLGGEHLWSNAQIHGNVASSRGAGICAVQSNIVIEKNDISNNILTCTSCAFPRMGGAGLYTTLSSLSVTSSSINGNKAAFHASAPYNEGYVAAILGGAVFLNNNVGSVFVNTSISFNQVTMTAVLTSLTKFNQEDRLGFIQGAALSLQLMDQYAMASTGLILQNVNIKYNTGFIAGNGHGGFNGGGVFIEHSPSFQVTSSRISHNTIVIQGPNSGGGGGAGVQMNRGFAQIIGSEISSNGVIEPALNSSGVSEMGVSGGGLWMCGPLCSDGGSHAVALTNTSIVNNFISAVDSGGGAGLVLSKYSILENVTVAGNQLAFTAGASKPPIRLGGAGIWVLGGETEGVSFMRRTIVDGNHVFNNYSTAESGGAGILSLLSNVNIQSSTIVNNFVLPIGIGGGLACFLNCTVIDSIVSNNSAGQFGGGVVAYASNVETLKLKNTFKISNTQIVNNTATKQGSAIYILGKYKINFNITQMQVADSNAVIIEGVDNLQYVVSNLSTVQSGQYCTVSGFSGTPISVTVDIRKNTVNSDKSDTTYNMNIDCKLCSPGQYMVTSAKLNNIQGSDPRQSQCFDCPFGGRCISGGNKLSAALGFWGQIDKNEGTVDFFECPAGYCCPSTRGCCYNFCAPGREGLLCGSCQKDHSQAIISANCVHNSKCKDSRWIIPSTFALCIIASFILAVRGGASSGQWRVISTFYQSVTFVADLSTIEQSSFKFVSWLSSILGGIASFPSSSHQDIQKDGECLQSNMQISHITPCLFPGMSAITTRLAFASIPIMLLLSLLVTFLLHYLLWLTARSKHAHRFSSAWKRTKFKLTSHSSFQEANFKTSVHMTELGSRRTALRDKTARNYSFNLFSNFRKFKSIWQLNYFAAIVVIGLLTFGSWSANSLQLLACTEINGELRLFMQADNVKCFASWQIVLLVVFCVIFAPFPLAILLFVKFSTRHKGLRISRIGQNLTASINDPRQKCDQDRLEQSEADANQNTKFDIFNSILTPSFKPGVASEAGNPGQDSSVDQGLATIATVISAPFQPKRWWWEAVMLWRRMALYLLSAFVFDPFWKAQLIFQLCLANIISNEIFRPFIFPVVRGTERLALAILVVLAGLRLRMATIRSIGGPPSSSSLDGIDSLEKTEQIVADMQAILVSVPLLAFVLMKIAQWWQALGNQSAIDSRFSQKADE